VFSLKRKGICVIAPPYQGGTGGGGGCWMSGNIHNHPSPLLEKEGNSSAKLHQVFPSKGGEEECLFLVFF